MLEEERTNSFKKKKINKQIVFSLFTIATTAATSKTANIHHPRATTSTAITTA